MKNVVINTVLVQVGQNIGLCMKNGEMRNGFRREYFGPIVRITETHLYLKNLIVPIDNILNMWDNWRNETDKSGNATHFFA
jgi:hypothetical protein